MGKSAIVAPITLPNDGDGMSDLAGENADAFEPENSENFVVKRPRRGAPRGRQPSGRLVFLPAGAEGHEAGR